MMEQQRYLKERLLYAPKERACLLDKPSTRTRRIAWRGSRFGRVECVGQTYFQIQIDGVNTNARARLPLCGGALARR